MYCKLAVLILPLLITGLVWPSTGFADLAPALNLTAGIRVGKVPLDMVAEQRLQTEVDAGHMPWRLEPIEVARADGQELGFVDADRFEPVQLPSPRGAGGPAVVRVVHGDLVFEIRLIQPVRAGPD